MDNIHKLYKLQGQTLIEPPYTGYLANGKSVTRYCFLPKATLEAEGWKRVEDMIINEPNEEELELYRSVVSLEDKGEFIERLTEWFEVVKSEENEQGELK